MTPGVCDKCWGSRSEDAPWRSHREGEQAEADLAEAVRLLKALQLDLAAVSGFLRMDESRWAERCLAMLEKVDAFLAKHDKPECVGGCEGTRLVASDCGAHVEACPECGCKLCDLGTIYGEDGSAKPCPDCQEGE